MDEKPERPFPMIADIVDSILGPIEEEEPQEVQDMRRWSKEGMEKNGNTNTV